MRGRFFILCTITLPICGCASFFSAPPICDGTARRPLNRSLWDWEAGTNLGAPQALATPTPALMRKADGGSSPLLTPLSANPAVEIASYRSCGRES